MYDHTKMARKSWFTDQQTVSKASEVGTSSMATTSVGGGGCLTGTGSHKIPIDEQPLAELKTLQVPGEKGDASRATSVDEPHPGAGRLSPGPGTAVSGSPRPSGGSPVLDEKRNGRREEADNRLVR